MSHDLYQLLYGQESLNLQLFLLVNHARHPLGDLLAPLLTYLGGSWAIYAYLPLLLAVSLCRGELLPRRYVWLYCLATVIGLGCENLLKELFQVPRPAAALGLEQVRVLGEVKLHNSLPSGHAVFAFLTAVMLGHRRSWRWQVPLYGFALAVAWQRVYVGAHYPLDVLAGALVGAVVGLSVWHGYEWLASRRSPP
jgi:undecaprenyl-diphosphatase